TVVVFNSLRVHPPYNSILLTAVDVLLEYDVNLRVEFIPGSENEIPDEPFSRFQNYLIIN
ncbi:hypothetical protein BDR04DRAFT_996657, partial [Suillus decipiens]